MSEPWRGAATVYGPPAQKGSVRAFASKSGRVIVKNDNQRAQGWEQELRCAMQPDAPPPPVPSRPVVLRVAIYLRRPASHYGTGRNAGKLKAGAPPFPTVKPDCDKCLRLIFDAGTGWFWKDDCDVVEVSVRKQYAEDGRERTELLAVEITP